MTASRGPAGPIIVGLLAGGLAGLFGVGGGILIVPGLVLISRMGQRRAHATSLAAIVPIALAGVAGYALDGAVDWPAAGLLAAGSVAGAAIGTRLLRTLPEVVLGRAFGAFMLASAIAFLFHLHGGAGRGALDVSLVALLVGAGVATGVLAGVLGVGGGILLIPVLVLGFGLPDAVAKGTSLAVIIPTALAGTVRNVRAGLTDVRAALIVGLAGVASAFLGSRLAIDLPPRVSGALFAALLVVVAARLLWTRRG